MKDFSLDFDPTTESYTDMSFDSILSQYELESNRDDTSGADDSGYSPLYDDEDDDGGEVVILKCDDSHAPDGEEGYVSIDDEDVLQAVFEIFKERFVDEFDFTD